MEQEYEKRGYLLEDFRLFHLREAQRSGVRPHYHEFCKVLLLLSGNGSYYLEGERYRLQAGDVVLVGAHRVHRPEFDPDSPYERMILYISPEFLRRFSQPDCDLLGPFTEPGSPVLRLEEGRRQQLFSMAAALERELAGDAYGKVILSSALVLRLLVELERCRRQGIVQQPRPVEPGDPRVQEMLRYLDEHLAEDVSADDLAEAVFLSKYHMMRLFRRETGTSVHAYLTVRRLTRARELMEGGMQATRACFQAGFRSYSAFIRSYERQYGRTPTGRGGGRLEAESFE